MKPRPEFYTSPLSRFCAEELPGDFHFLDGDLVLFAHSALPVVYARETGVLRILESKNRGEEIRRSQRETLPLLAGCLQLGETSGLISKGSGVFVVEAANDWNVVGITRVRAATRPGVDWQAIGAQPEEQRVYSRQQLERFLRCRS